MHLIDIFIHAIKEASKITLFVLVMMMSVDFINVKTRGNLESILKSGKRWKQYIVASLLGATPGCLGAFVGVSLYIHGMLSLGALTGLMFTASGDEMFVMLAIFPKTAIVIIAILLFLGIFVGFFTDYLIKRFNIPTCTDCQFKQYHIGKEGYKHYFKDHIFNHIIKRHILKIFLWTFGAMLLVEYGMSFFDLKSITSEHVLLLLILGALIGIIPESGPHLIFVMLFANGLVPFSVLFTSTIVQDGHGMLPMLSFSVKDSLKIKMFNLAFGLVAGFTIYLLGY